MKKILFLLSVSLFFSCSKDGSGNLELTVSYFYNDFQGYKPDVGSTVYIFDDEYSKVIFPDSMSIIAARTGMIIDKDGKPHLYEQKGEADVSGKINIDNIKSGQYFIILASKGRWLYSTKLITIQDDETFSLVKNFGYKNEYSKYPESW